MTRTLEPSGSAADRLGLPEPGAAAPSSLRAGDDRFPLLKEILASGALDEGQEDEPAETFDFGLQRMLNGVEAFITARSTPK